MTETKFKIISRPFAMLAAIFAEYDPSENRLRDALRQGHGIILDENPEAENRIYFVIDSEMADKLKEYRIPNPTLLQLLGTSRCIASSEQEAKEKFRAMLNAEN